MSPNIVTCVVNSSPSHPALNLKLAGHGALLVAPAHRRPPTASPAIKASRSKEIYSMWRHGSPFDPMPRGRLVRPTAGWSQDLMQPTSRYYSLHRTLEGGQVRRSSPAKPHLLSTSGTRAPPPAPATADGRQSRRRPASASLNKPTATRAPPQRPASAPTVTCTTAAAAAASASSPVSSPVARKLQLGSSALRSPPPPPVSSPRCEMALEEGGGWDAVADGG